MKPRTVARLRALSAGLGKVAGAATWVAILALALQPIVRFLQVALARIHYPFELEWMEGGVVSHVQVVLSGEPLYREPSLTFTPFIYPPLYYYASALVSLVSGPGYFAPRLVSLVSLLGCLVLIGWWVRDEGDDALCGVVAAGVFAASYGVTGFWFDIARLDSFALLLVLLAYRSARRARGTKRAVAAGLLLTAACFTKQTALPLAVPALIGLGLRAPRLGLWAASVFVASTGGLFLLYDLRSSGWFHYYLFTLPGQHEIAWRALPDTVRQYFWTPAAPLALSAGALLAGLGAWRGKFGSWILHALFVSVAYVTSLLALLHTGGYPNALFPAYAALSIAFGLALAALGRGASQAALGGLAPRLFTAGALALQSALLAYAPDAQIPSAQDRAGNQHLVAELARLPRPLWVISSSYYSVLAGQPDVVTHVMGPVDVTKGTGPVATRFREHFAEAMRQHRFKSIVLDRADGFLPSDLTAILRQNYRYKGSLWHARDSAIGWPKTGASIRPDGIWVAR